MKTTNTISHCCRYYVLFCTKYKRKVLDEDIRLRLSEIIRTECKALDIDLLNSSLHEDRVQLYLDIPPQLGVHKAIKHLKRTSSHLLRNEYHKLTTKLPTLWTNTYLVSTIDPSDAEIQKFLDAQKTSQRK